MIRASCAIAVLAGIAPASAGEHAGRVVRIEQAGGREVFVPAGDFTMGVPSERERDALEANCVEMLAGKDSSFGGGKLSICAHYETELDNMALRHVTLSAFAIDRDEVAVARYRACIAAGVCPLDPMIDGDERYIRDEWPLVNVTWDEAQVYCHWRGGRLPTEAEWERAASGDGARIWPWGTADRPRDFNHGKLRDATMLELARGASEADLIGDPDDSDGAAVLAPPGSYPWNEGPHWVGGGARDLAGNVAEWTADAYGTADATVGYTDLPGCTATDQAIHCINPVRDRVPEGDQRVVRGGSWRQPAWLAHPYARDPFNYLYSQNRRFSHIGFRCARSL